MKISKYTLIIAAAALFAVSAQAELKKFVPASGDINVDANWLGGAGLSQPTSTDEAAFANPDVGQGDQTLNVNVDHTVQKLTTTFAAQGVTNTVSGPGTLTIDGGANWAVGVANQAGNAGGRLNMAGNVEINNAAGVTDIRTGNSSGNVLEFTPTSTLTLTTVGVTLNFGSGGQIDFNGAIDGAANLMIQCNNVSFNGDSSAHTGNILMNGSAAFLAVNGGTLGNSGTALVGNYGSNEVELNGANVINGMNIKSYGAFLLDVNAAQDDMGVIQEVNSNGLTIDITDLGEGEELWFADNSGASSGWYGTMAIVGFEEGKIRFGTDANGLTSSQLAIISDNTYGLTETGYLTVITGVTGEIVVDYDSAYVVTNARPADIITSNGYTWAFSETEPLMNASGQNRTIYGGVISTWALATNYVPELGIINGAIHAKVDLRDELNAVLCDLSLKGMYVWKQEDFLLGSNGTVSFTNGNALILTLQYQWSGGQSRFVVKEGGVYYASDASASSGGVLDIDPSDATVNWAPINTNDYTIGTYAPMTFSDIEAVGIIFDYSKTTGGASGIFLTFTDYRTRAMIEWPPITEIGNITGELIGDQLIMSWPAVHYGSYALEGTTDLLGGWSNIETNIPGVDGTLSRTNTVDQAQEFFRIRAE